jgi:hypothetical protein
MPDGLVPQVCFCLLIVVSQVRLTGLSDKWLPPIDPLRPSQGAHNRRVSNRANVDERIVLLSSVDFFAREDR